MDKEILAKRLLVYFEKLHVHAVTGNYRIGSHGPDFVNQLEERTGLTMGHFLPEYLPRIIELIEAASMLPGKYAIDPDNMLVIVNFRPYKLPDSKHHLFLVTVFGKGERARGNTTLILAEWLEKYCGCVVEEGYFNTLIDPDFGEEVYVEGYGQDVYGIAFYILPRDVYIS